MGLEYYTYIGFVCRSIFILRIFIELIIFFDLILVCYLRMGYGYSDLQQVNYSISVLNVNISIHIHNAGISETAW